MHDDTTARCPRYLTVDEEADCNDIWHPLGCNCHECRPDLAEELTRVAREEAA